MRVLAKRGLVGVWNGCIVTRGDLEASRLQLAAAVLSTAGGALGLVQLRESSSSRWGRDVSETRSSVAT